MPEELIHLGRHCFWSFLRLFALFALLVLRFFNRIIFLILLDCQRCGTFSIVDYSRDVLLQPPKLEGKPRTDLLQSNLFFTPERIS